MTKNIGRKSEIYECNIQQEADLDSLINDFKIKDYELKTAILKNNYLMVEKLDKSLACIEQQILDFDWITDFERKTLFDFIFSQYLNNEEATAAIPHKVRNRIKSLFD